MGILTPEEMVREQLQRRLFSSIVPKAHSNNVSDHSHARTPPYVLHNVHRIRSTTQPKLEVKGRVSEG
jgi:hypothetical protein